MRTIESTFHSRSAAHLPRRNLLLNFTGQIHDSPKYDEDFTIEGKLQKLEKLMPKSWYTEIG
jgi:hypothetical protein